MPDDEKTKIWDADRMTKEDLDKELGSATGKERAYRAKEIGEDWGFTVGEEAGVKKTVASQAESIEAVKEAAAKDVALARSEGVAAVEKVIGSAGESITAARKEGFDAGVASVDVPDATEDQPKPDSGDTDTSEYDRGVADGLAQAVPAEAGEEEMVPCPECNATGKMIGWGDQCKKCYGATKVKASSLVEEVEADG